MDIILPYCLLSVFSMNKSKWNTHFCIFLTLPCIIIFVAKDETTIETLYMCYPVLIFPTLVLFDRWKSK